MGSQELGVDIQCPFTFDAPVPAPFPASFDALVILTVFPVQNGEIVINIHNELPITEFQFAVESSVPIDDFIIEGLTTRSTRFFLLP